MAGPWHFFCRYHPCGIASDTTLRASTWRGYKHSDEKCYLAVGHMARLDCACAGRTMAKTALASRTGQVDSLAASTPDSGRCLVCGAFTRDSADASDDNASRAIH